MCINSRKSLAGRVSSTPKISSQALAAARWWLTGQMPQILGVITGISQKTLPSQNFSKPRNCVTWNLASATFPESSSCIVTLPCPSIRLTGFISIVLLTSVAMSSPLSSRSASYRWAEQGFYLPAALLTHIR